MSRRYATRAPRLGVFPALKHRAKLITPLRGDTEEWPPNVDWATQRRPPLDSLERPPAMSPDEIELSLFSADRIEPGFGSEQQAVAGDRRRGQRHFVLRIDAEHLKGFASLYDVGSAFFVQAKDLAVVGPG